MSLEDFMITMDKLFLYSPLESTSFGLKPYIYRVQLEYNAKVDRLYLGQSSKIRL